MMLAATLPGGLCSAFALSLSTRVRNGAAKRWLLYTTRESRAVRNRYVKKATPLARMLIEAVTG